MCALSSTATLVASRKSSAVSNEHCCTLFSSPRGRDTDAMNSLRICGGNQIKWMIKISKVAKQQKKTFGFSKEGSLSPLSECRCYESMFRGRYCEPSEKENGNGLAIIVETNNAFRASCIVRCGRNSTMKNTLYLYSVYVLTHV